MADRAQPWRRYGFALGTVAVAALITSAVPFMRDRLTFFLFWPTILVVGWIAGAGPALAATALAMLAAAFHIAGAARLSAQPDLLLSLVVFGIGGGFVALLARARARGEATAQESGERFRALANSVPVLIWETGSDGRFIYVNDSWLTFTDRPLEAELGSGWLERLHPDDRAPWTDAFARAAAERRPLSLEYRLCRFDGTYRSFLVRGAPRPSASGELAGYVGSATDITEERAAVTLAEDALREAERASRAKDDFLATVSHELRAPLSPILTWVRMLHEGALDAEKQARALEVIERNARMEAQLIEDLLDVSRIVGGKMRLQVQPVVLADVVQHALDTIQPAADAKGIRLQPVLDSTVDPISGDPDRLQQVVWNLLSNAVKFTPKNGRVQVVLERVNSHVEIAVIDTGQGIAPEHVSRLFDRFWQGDASPDRGHVGLGLGLAIVRHLVELHGGTVTAESPGEGHGSTFTVKLPVSAYVRTAGETVRRHPIAARGEPAAMARLDSVRVLVVDDDPDANEALRVLLGSCGAEVRVAGSAAHALDILDRWHPDVLLSDIGMPGMDGYGLLAAIRARTDARAQVPALALTAFASTDDRVRLLSAGFQMHVAKPADPGELVAAIAAVLARGTARPSV
jgi:PAS domain S-box-containing protein